MVPAGACLQPVPCISLIICYLSAHRLQIGASGAVKNFFCRKWENRDELKKKNNKTINLYSVKNIFLIKK